MNNTGSLFDSKVGQNTSSHDVNKFVDNIRKKIKSLEEEEYIINNKPIEIPPEISLLLKNSNNAQSPKDYQILLQKQKQMQFMNKANNTSDNPEHLLSAESESQNNTTIRFGPGANLLEDLDIKCYQRQWGKLEHELKINRAMHFVKREIQDKKLTEEQSKALRILLVYAINNRIITKKAEVDYDVATGELKQIYKLCFDESTKAYHLKDCENPPQVFLPPKKGENGYISHISELTPDQLTIFLQTK